MSVDINRYTERIHTVYLFGGRTPDRPSVVVTEQEAKQSAQQLWERSESYVAADRVVANLQYFPATGDQATQAGREFETQKRLRLCWLVTFRSERFSEETNETSSMAIGLVAIDAETGEVLVRPN
jgi:hypothetical protein